MYFHSLSGLSSNCLFKMSSNLLIEVLSEFDINYKYYKISVKQQLNKNYGKNYWFLCFVLLSLLSFNTFILFLISDEYIDSLNKYGSIGYSSGGKISRLMVDAAVIIFYCCEFLIIVYHFLDKMLWLLKMSSIYEEIRTRDPKTFDKYLLKII